MRARLRAWAWVFAIAGAVAGTAYIVLTLVLTTGDYDRYGKVPLPGEGRLALEEGTAVVNYQAQANLPSDHSIDEPANLRVRVRPVGGGEPLRLEDGRRIASYNHNALSGTSVWRVEIPETRRYGVTARGDGGYPSEEIAFGAYSDMGTVLLRGFLMIVGGLLVAGALMLQSRRLRKPPATLPGRA